MTLRSVLIDVVFEKACRRASSSSCSSALARCWTRERACTASASAVAAPPRSSSAATAALRRPSSSIRPGSRLASSAITSSPRRPRASPSDSTCWRSNCSCCCRRSVSSCCWCAASRAAVACASAASRPPRVASRRRLQGGHRDRRLVLAAAGVVEPCTGRRDGLLEGVIPPREQDLLPATQLLAQATVLPRLGRLPLQRVPLLFELVDDVVDADEILLGRVELQFGGPPARLVLRHPRRFLDELPPIGRFGAQDLADLALLDDGVALDAHPGVHQEVLHVAQAAHVAVDQVFALARPVQPPRDFDVAQVGRGQLHLHGLVDQRVDAVDGA